MWEPKIKKPNMCTKKSCGASPDVKNAEHVQLDNLLLFGDAIDYNCKIGYERQTMKLNLSIFNELC